MNTSRPWFVPAGLTRAGRLFFALLGVVSTVEALTTDEINQEVWARIYGVTPAQLASGAFLAADNDGDGQTNGQELAAGTNPFLAGSVIKISSIATSTSSSAYLDLTFGTQNGKQYVAQGKVNLSDATWAAVTDPSPAVSALIGDGSSRKLTVPKNGLGGFKYFRVLVQDAHSDGDLAGVSDWAKRQTGLDPKNQFSNKQTDPYGAPLDDRTFVSNGLNSAVENFVTIVTRLAESTATQPDAGNTATNSGLFTITRGGLAALLKPITVNLTISGTAVSGQDYSPLPTTVSFLAGETTQTILVTPITPPAARLASVTVTATLASGTGYTLPSSNLKTATVVIYPSATATGTGLAGTYYKTASTTYANAANFDSAQIGLTRTDATIDFTSGSGGWGSASGPTGMVGETDGVFSVRWIGQIQPQFSELYTFFVSSNDGARLRINNVDVIGISNWFNTSSNTEIESFGSIVLTAGVKYDIQLDYFSNAGSSFAGVHLKWMSPNQSKVVVPQNRLYPTSGVNSAPPIITSSPVAYGYLGQSVNGQAGFTVTASNLASPIPAGTFALVSGTLPTGLSLNAQSGAITGIPAAAGDYQVVVSATKSGVGTSTASLDIQIFDTGNGFTREVWQNIAATTNIWDIPVTTPPNITGQVSAITLEDNVTTYGNNYGERISGFITPPSSGNYYFWISANDSAELWVSNNNEPANKVKRSSVNGGSATKRQWTIVAGQKSPWLALIGGQKYYVEVLHKAVLGANNHVSVAWYKDPMGNSGTGYVGAPAYPANISGASATASSATTGGVVPGYATWKFFATPLTSAPGSLYTANLLPEVVGSTGLGSATLRVSADGTSAVLAASYSGLTGSKSAWHIHADAYKRTDGSIGATQGEILFDIDTAPPNPDGTYTWDLTTPPTGTTTADMQEILRQGKAYVNVHTAPTFTGGEILGYLTQANGSPTFTPPPDPPGLTGTENATDSGASRFLSQATFGPTPSDIAFVKANGFQSWLTNQFGLASSHPADYIVRQTLNVAFPGSQMWNSWWRRAVLAPDQLRQRIAYALSETLVISDVGPLNNIATTQANYYDILLDDAFTNFRTILKDVTLRPAMGRYLDMVSNDKGNATTGLHANENYAREINQLFSIGLNRMWPDGSLVMDSNGQLVPTYTQNVITGFSDALTGWSYDQPDGSGGRLPFNFVGASTANGNTTWLAPMKLTRYHHELGSKLLLDNVVIPPVSGYPQILPNYMNTIGGYLLGSVVSGSPADINTSNTVPSGPYAGRNLYDANGLLDLDTAIDNIINNQNVGPFICRQLIQRLVTSSPSPAYLYRVVRAFNGERNSDGVRTNVRGDMKDVIKAILFDYEARSNDVLVSANFQTYGKQREPVLRVTAASRYFLSQNPGFDGTYSQTSSFVTDFGSTTERPVNRIKVTTSTPHRLTNGDTVFLQFNSNATTVNALPANGAYTVRTSDATNFTIDTKEVAQGNWSWSGSTITVNTNPITYNVSTGGGAVNFGLDLGNSLYLNFVPDSLGGPAPTNGEYTITAVDNTLNNLTVVYSPGGVAGSNPVNPGAAITANPNTGPFLVVPRITTGVSYRYTTGNPTSTVNYLIPHGLNSGDFVYLDGSTVLQGRRQVTVTDAFNFTVTIPPPSTSSTTTGLIVYDLKGPVLDRSGGTDPAPGALVAVQTQYSTWLMGQTDGESTTASVGQTPLRAQTVFNYFFPDYQFPGSLASAGATTPEFQLTSESGTMLLTNAIEQGILSGGNANGLSSFKNNSGAIVLDYQQVLPAGVEQAGVNLMTGLTSNTGIPQLVDVLNHHLAGGNISAATKASIVSFVTSTSPNYFPFTYISGTPTPTQLNQMRDRIRAVVHLIVTSPEYAIQK